MIYYKGLKGFHKDHEGLFRCDKHKDWEGFVASVCIGPFYLISLFVINLPEAYIQQLLL